MKQINSYKAARPDSTPVKALKADGTTTAHILHDLFNNVWTREEFPSDWKEGHLMETLQTTTPTEA